MQALNYDPATETISKSDNECLGADDGSGVWILINLINQGNRIAVPLFVTPILSFQVAWMLHHIPPGSLPEPRLLYGC